LPQKYALPQKSPICLKSRRTKANHPSFEDGKSAITLLLYSLSAISLLFFAYGLICLAINHPAVGIPLAFVITVSFSILASKSNRTKNNSKNAADKYNRPNTFITAFAKMKQVLRKHSISKRGYKDTHDTKNHSHKTNRSNNNKEYLHNKPPQ
jgi:hypothetical protein